MNKSKLLLLSLLLCCVTLNAQKYNYEVVKNDPFNAKIYTLKNGMKVYMSVYKDVPKIQTYIAVRVGSKNDPKETTGLAHYLEHLMFKGTQQIGTINWAEEEPLLRQIEDNFELYRSETEQNKRDYYYHIIDSLSYLASGYAVPNEYVKMMKFIGSTGTNAWTSNDNTVFTEQIPSNQLETWAMIQADRFQHPVIRLFHTELETVYEEKNRSLTNDSRKVNEAMLSMLFPHHPYGTQTTLGEAEHLKNPSIKNIRNYIEKYYVPNNIAICLAGDFDPDNAVDIIEKYFGDWQPKSFQRLKPVQETPNDGVMEKTITGLEASFVTIAYRMEFTANHLDIYHLRMLDYLLNNGKTGLIDLNINQKNLTASASSYPYILADNSAFVLTGEPKNGQSLEEVKTLLLAQLDLIRKGEFDEELLQASLNNMRLSEMRQLESINGRARQLLNSFTNDVPWSEACHSADYYAAISKQDMIDFVNEYFNDGQCVVVYKEQGKPEAIANVPKPAITPIQINRDAESDFFKKLKSQKIPSIEPVFVDFANDIQQEICGNVKIFSVQNTENQTFNISFRFSNVGELYDKRWPVAAALNSYLSTENKDAETIRREFYRMACSMNVSCSDDYVEVTLSGLSENFEAALRLMLEVLHAPALTDDAFAGIIEKMSKSLNDAKSNQSSVLSALRSYGEYGKQLVAYSLKPNDLAQLKSNEILALYKSLCEYPFEVFYYGPLKSKGVAKSLKKNASTMLNNEKKVGEKADFKNQEVVENQVIFVPYDAKQSRLVTYSRGPLFDAKLQPTITMYNAYFGGGMSAIVFQEMREKRSLAYTAQSSFILPAKKDDYMYNYSFIGTQNDKVLDAWTAFDELFDSMPLSETSFALAKETMKNDIANTRYTKRNLLTYFIRVRNRGFNYDYRRDVWNAIDGFTLNDVVEFNKKYIKNQPKTYMILAREGDVDIKSLEQKFGKVIKLSLEDVFGF